MEMRRTEIITTRLTPQEKQEIVAAAKEKGVSISELMLTSFKYWRERGSASKQETTKSTTLDLAAHISKIDKILTYINRIQRAKPSSLTLRALYENLLDKVSSDKDLTEIVKAEFFAKFGVPPLLLKKPGLRVYPDMIIIDFMQCKAEYLELIPADGMQERIDILIENFPFRHYNIIAEAQCKVWELCRTEREKI